MNLKSATTNTALMALALAFTTTAHAQWHVYKTYEVPGLANRINAGLCVNSYNEVGGLGDTNSNSDDFTGMLGGVNVASTFYNLPGSWSQLQYNAMNDAGQVAADALITGRPTAISFQPYSPITSMVNGIANISSSFALGINHGGVAVGYYRIDNNNGQFWHMFRWNDATNSRTGDWLNYIAGGINENGTMVAQNVKPTNYYMLPELAIVPSTGPTTIVNAPGDYLFMQPLGVSTDGGPTVIGWASTSAPNSSNTHLEAFVYSQAYGWQILEGPGGNFMETHSLAIDYWGTKVAGYTVDASGNQVAMMWSGVNSVWTATPLSTILPTDPTWQYQQATGINPQGTITGFGLHHEGEKWIQRAFVAVPTNIWQIDVNEGGVFGGLIVNSSVAVDQISPFDLNYTLASAPGPIHVPHVVPVRGGARSGEFTFQTDGVDVATPVTVVTSLGGAPNTKTFMVRPAILSSLAIHQNSDGVTGQIELMGAAGPSGLTIGLTSSNPQVLVPAVMKIRAGASSAGFKITVGRVRKGTSVTITATLGDGSVDQTFTVG